MKPFAIAFAQPKNSLILVRTSHLPGLIVANRRPQLILLLLEATDQKSF